ncbi:MAG: 23S rRNA pseudouridine(955/2504/2580) synthase RluC [Gammaproteobacteria bacterium]|nr:23S rRNA pseudouridine(955/2504/2580) synthase RluC [Gammaproteobacteria bacterium]MDE2460600.1 23S rRNA pseudouridine(955/2504/2580) synthase RluC [Gammaproteobacteria bacterium]
MENLHPKARRVSIADEQAQQRLDNFLLRELKGVPKSHVYRLLRTGQVRVNGRRAKPDYRLAGGDEIRIPPVRQSAPGPQTRPGSRQQAALQAAILHEDAELLVLNKPAGWAVHGGSGVSLGVIEALRAMRPGERYLELVHRLDRDTSGCLLVARKPAALRALHRALRAGEVDKRYLALLAGAWAGGERRVRLALQKNVLQSGERMVRVAEEGREAESHFRPLKRFRGATLMEIAILTGRTHQIRVHAAHLGYPVLGDDKYGDREANRQFRSLGLKRMFLHAASLSFVHPGTGAALQVSAPLDAQLQMLLDKLDTLEKS